MDTSKASPRQFALIIVLLLCVSLLGALILARFQVATFLLKTLGSRYGFSIDAQIKSLSLSTIELRSFQVQTDSVACALTNVVVRPRVFTDQAPSIHVESVLCQTRGHRVGPTQLHLSSLRLPGLPALTLQVDSFSIFPEILPPLSVHAELGKSSVTATFHPLSKFQGIQEIQVRQDPETLIEALVHCFDPAQCQNSFLRVAASGIVEAQLPFPSPNALQGISLRSGPSPNSQLVGADSTLNFSGVLPATMDLSSIDSILRSLQSVRASFGRAGEEIFHLSIENGVLTASIPSPLTISFHDATYALESARAELSLAPQESSLSISGLSGSITQQWLTSPVDVEVLGVVSPSTAQGVIKANTLSGELLAKAAFTWSDASGFDLPKISLQISSDRTLSTQHIPTLPEHWSIVAPHADASLSLQEPYLSSLSVSSLTLQANSLSTIGIHGTLHLERSGQSLKISSDKLLAQKAVTPITLSNIQTSFHGSIPGTMKIPSLTAQAFNGVVYFDPFTLHTPNPLPWAGQLNFHQIDLAEIIKLYGKDDLEVTGQILGSVDLRILQDGRFEIPTGSFSTDGKGGQIQYRSPSKQTDSTLSMIQRALEDYHYTDLRGTIRLSPAGLLNIELRLKGTAPQVNTTRSVNVNLTIEEDLDALFKSLHAVRDASQVLQKGGGKPKMKARP